MTWRLYGSVPGCRLDPLLKSDPRPGYRFAAEDRLFDRSQSGPLWLADEGIASMAAEAIRDRETVRGFYELHAWVIMPNHVHILITPLIALPSVMRWLKASTAHTANKMLGRSGHPFWERESFDRWIRSGDEFNRTRRYIEHNPVHAGFVDKPELWRWSSGWAGASARPT